MSKSNDIEVSCRVAGGKKFAAIAQEAVAESLAHLKKRDVRVEVYIVGDVEMKRLNGKTTNVLAYSSDKTFPRPETPRKMIGELYLNPGYIKKHGEQFEYLVIHGLLHLFGFDHKKKDDTLKMRRYENRLLSQLQKLK